MSKTYEENSDSDDSVIDELEGLPAIPRNIHQVKQRSKIEIASAEEICAARQKKKVSQERLKQLLDFPDKIVLPDDFHDEHEIEELLNQIKLYFHYEPSVQFSPPLINVFDASCSCAYFNEDTLDANLFFPTLPSNVVLSIILQDKELIMRGLCNYSFEIMECEHEDGESLCLYFFYLMSVHSDYAVANGCYSFLINHDFRPKFSDVINIFLNWGADLRYIYKVVPSKYEGFPENLKVLPSATPSDILEHNMELVFQYLTHIFVSNFSVSYISFFEPLLYISLDKKIFFSRVRNDIVRLLERLEPRINKLLDKIFPLSMVFENQVTLCCNILQDTHSSLPMAYACLCHFLNEEFEFGSEISMKSLYHLAMTKDEIFRKVKPCEMYCVILLFNLCVSKTCRKFEGINEKFVENIYDKFYYYSHKMDTGKLTTDPAVLKEAIARAKYQWNLHKRIFPLG